MAEQYASFQGREPNIDVNLFTNARTQGIAAGNAQKSTISSIVQGGLEGVETGMAITQGIANIQQTQAQTGLIKAQTAATEQKTAGGGADPQEVLKNQEAQQKLGDLAILEQVGGLVAQYGAGNRAIDLDSTFSNPELAQVLARNRKEGLRLIAMANTAGLDPQIGVAQVDNIYAAESIEQAQARKQEIAKQNQTFAIKTQNDFEAAHAALTKYPEALKGNPNTLEIFSEDAVVIRGNKLEKQANGSYTLAADSSNPTSKARPDNKVLVRREEDGSYTVVGRNVPDSYEKFVNDYVIGANIRPAFSETTIGGVTKDQMLNAVAPTRTTGGGGGGLADRRAAAATQQNMNTPVQQAVQDAAASLDKARANGVGTSWMATFEQAKNITRGKQMGTPGYLMPQSTPTPAGEVTLTIPQTDYKRIGLPAPTAKIGTKEYANQQLSNLLGGVPAELNVDYTASFTDQAIATIEGIPAMQDMPALIKGQALVESGGKISALSSKGAAGLMQLMPGTAADLGLTAEQRLDPTYAVPAAVKYMKMQYSAAEKTLDKALRDTGSIIKPDPRMVLAAYNGGGKWIQDAIRAGNTDWDSVKAYIKANKSAANAKENIEYVDKVIAASVPFIKGGNASDDSYVRDLMNFGIVSTYLPSEP